MVVVSLRDYDVDGHAALWTRLSSNRPEPVALCFIHGDFTWGNVLVAGDRVVGNIDWRWGAISDPSRAPMAAQVAA